MKRLIRLPLATGAVVCALAVTGLTPAHASSSPDPDEIAEAVAIAAPTDLDALALTNSGDQFVAAPAEGGKISTGVDPADGLSFSSTDGAHETTVTLPGAGRLEDAVLSSDGSITFVGNHSVPSVNVITAEDAVRVSTVITTADQTESFAYDFGPGAVVELQNDGSALVLSDDTSDSRVETILAVIDAPWARDAAGNVVDTSYVAAGSILTQIVAHQEANVVYPVVADPRFDSPNIFQSRVRFTRAETQTMADQGVFAFGGAICGPLAAACIAAAGVVVVQASLASNSRPKKCVQITATNASLAVGLPPVFWVDHYACN